MNRLIVYTPVNESIPCIMLQVQKRGCYSRASLVSLNFSSLLKISFHFQSHNSAGFLHLGNALVLLLCEFFLKRPSVPDDPKVEQWCVSRSDFFSYAHTLFQHLCNFQNSISNPRVSFQRVFKHTQQVISIYHRYMIVKLALNIAPFVI